MPLVPGSDWWRAHSHVTALTPVVTGRAILNGTFTHPSPVAGFLYSGSARAPITRLVEERDGVTLFGRPLAELTPVGFADAAATLGVSAVVALEEDAERLRFLSPESGFVGPERVGPFILFLSTAPRALPEPVSPERLTLSLPGGATGWVGAGIGYSPLWTAAAAGRRLETRQGPAGMLEVWAASATAATAELSYAPGVWEWAGSALSLAACLFMCLGRLWRLTA
jgi:hypothetical protein